MEAISTTARIVSSLEDVNQVSVYLQQLWRNNREAKDTSEELGTSMAEMRTWQERWANQSLYSNVSAITLWGVQGWTTVASLLNKVSRSGEEVKRLVALELQEANAEGFRQTMKKRFRNFNGKETRTTHQTELAESVRTLKKSVHELTVHTYNVFVSVQGQSDTGSRSSDRDILVHLAIQSRKASLLLYHTLLVRPEDSNLEMALLDHDTASRNSEHRTETTPSVTYRLLFDSSEHEFRNFTVRYTPETQLSDAEIATSIEPGADSELFGSSSPSTITLKIPHDTPGRNHYLRIDQAQPHTISLHTPPETLSKILEGMHYTRDKPPKVYLTPKAKVLYLNAKVSLALRLAECTLFLLGTPWLSCLSSENLRTCSSDKAGRLGFMLRIQALEYQDLLGDDHNALAEGRQLWRLGVILMNIALNISYTGDLAEDGEIPGVDSIMLDHNGPLVQSAMGERYYDAMVFCFRHRRDGFKGPEKYEEKGRAKWEAYLTRLLGDFYRCVYLKLYELNKIFADQDT